MRSRSAAKVVFPANLTALPCQISCLVRVDLVSARFVFYARFDSRLEDWGTLEYYLFLILDKRDLSSEIWSRLEIGSRQVHLGSVKNRIFFVVILNMNLLFFL